MCGSVCTFVLDGTSSQISENSGGGGIEVEQIDEICKDINVTFIKMDIEGAELKALVGAKNTIVRDKPKCAISVYHEPEDLFKIPLYLKQLNPNYKFYLRLYTLSLDEIVLYAV